jgi:hypothetical protein
LTQAPLQAVCPVLQLVVHAPVEHTWLPEQVVVQLPQCAGSVWVLTQLPLHDVCPLGQPQDPPLQVSPLAQALPQALQFAGSV